MAATIFHISPLLAFSIPYIMPLFSSKKKSAQAATLTIQRTSVPLNLRDNNIEPAQGRTTAGVQRPSNARDVAASPARAAFQPVYQWINADRREIRLLEVLPGVCPQPIHCIVRPACLLAAIALQYETVSYCWGQSRKNFPVTLNNQRWLIEGSTGCVLHRVRLPDRSRLVWIDAVCINQNDDVEKSQQVSIMGDIYRCARQNIVYFGESLAFSPAIGTTLLAVLADMKKKIPKDATLFEMVHHDAYGYNCKMGRDGRLLDPKIGLRPLNTLYSDSWFRRIWVMQSSNAGNNHD